MAQIKHRPFNADRFLDKFRGSEAALTAYIGLLDGLIPGLPEPFEVDAFKEKECAHDDLWPCPPAGSEDAKRRPQLLSSKAPACATQDVYMKHPVFKGKFREH